MTSGTIAQIIYLAAIRSFTSYNIFLSLTRSLTFPKQLSQTRMKFTTSLILALSLFPTVAVAGPLTTLFNLLFRSVIQDACESSTSALGLDALTCSCDVEYLGLFQGFAGDLSCATKTPSCFDGLCATGSVNASLAASLTSGAGLTGDVNACFTIETGIDPQVLTDPEICLTFVPSGLSLSSCTAEINDTPCNNCTICPSGAAFNFNCSNVDLLPNSDITVKGPATTTCIGLDLIA